MQIVKHGQKLVFIKSGEPVLQGDVVSTFRGEQVTVVGGEPPHSQRSSGHVFVRDAQGRESEFYVGVINAKWVLA